MEPKLIHQVSLVNYKFYLFDIGKNKLPFALYENVGKYTDGTYHFFQYQEYYISIISDDVDVFGLVKSFLTEDQEFMGEYWNHP